jgi:TPR repeat protein
MIDDQMKPYIAVACGRFLLKKACRYGVLKLSLLVLGLATFSAQGQSGTFEQQVEALNKLPSAELLRLAEKSQPMAMYCYGLREWQEAWNDNSAAFAWSYASTANQQDLPDAQKAEAEKKWAASSEAEIIAAGKAGDRGAAWLLGKQGSARARQRGLKAFDWFKKAAEAGFAAAQYEVAQRYLGLNNWEIVPVAPREGLRYLQMSADRKVEIAQHKIADLYLEGKLVPRDLKKGIEYLQKAVDQDCPRAQCELAWQYMNGNGEPRHNGETVVALLKKSAEQNYNLALVELGHHYRAGLGVGKDTRKAMAFYQKAAALDETLDWQYRSDIADFLANWKDAPQSKP